MVSNSELFLSATNECQRYEGRKILPHLWATQLARRSVMAAGRRCRTRRSSTGTGLAFVPPAPRIPQGPRGRPHSVAHGSVWETPPAAHLSSRAFASGFRNPKLWEPKSFIIGYKQTHLWPPSETSPWSSWTVQNLAFSLRERGISVSQGHSLQKHPWKDRQKERQAVSSLTSLEEALQIRGKYLPSVAEENNRQKQTFQRL